jgi:hypothetical protein
VPTGPLRISYHASDPSRQIGTITTSAQSALFRHRNNADSVRPAGVRVTRIAERRFPGSGALGYLLIGVIGAGSVIAERWPHGRRHGDQRMVDGTACSRGSGRLGLGYGFACGGVPRWLAGCAPEPAALRP